MRQLQAIQTATVANRRRLVMVGLLITGLSGCQAMMMAKKKPQVPQEQFSCGEKMPDRISSAPARRPSL